MRNHDGEKKEGEYNNNNNTMVLSAKTSIPNMRAAVNHCCKKYLVLFISTPLSKLVMGCYLFQHE
jgi:hypothetical protein